MGLLWREGKAEGRKGKEAGSGVGEEMVDEEWLPENIDEIDDGLLQKRLAAVGMQELLEISTKEVTDAQEKNTKLEKELKRLRQQDKAHTQQTALREAFYRWRGWGGRAEKRPDDNENDDDDDDDDDDDGADNTGSFFSGAVFGGVATALVCITAFSFFSGDQGSEQFGQRGETAASYRTKDSSFANSGQAVDIIGYSTHIHLPFLG